MDLGVLRDHIDDIDKQIIRLFEERMDVAEQVARYKISCGKPVYDPVRERVKLREQRIWQRAVSTPGAWKHYLIS